MTEYYINNGSYPYQGTGYNGLSACCNPSWNSEITSCGGGTALAALLKPYLNSLPVDPINVFSIGQGGYKYYQYYGAMYSSGACASNTGNPNALGCLRFNLKTSNQRQAKSECSGKLLSNNICIISF